MPRELGPLTAADYWSAEFTDDERVALLAWLIDHLGDRSRALDTHAIELLGEAGVRVTSSVRDSSGMLLLGSDGLVTETIDVRCRRPPPCWIGYHP